MAGPFLNNIRGTTSGTPGTGAFTPNAAAAGSSAWSTVYSGWIGLVRYEDGSAWELRFGYWNGTTISRPANGFHSSSTGSGLTLTSAATAELIIDGGRVQPHLGANYSAYMETILGANTITSMGAANTNLGTPSAKTLATTNYLTEQPAHIFTSLTTPASSAAGLYMSTSPRCVFSTAAGRGGGEFVCRFGASQLPTAPKLWCGFQNALNTSTGEPSSYFNIAMFGKDSTDTNIQLMTNDGSGAATKSDTGIALVANGWYEASVWFDPGGAKVYGLLIRLDTGDIWFGSIASNLPANGSLLAPYLYGSLSATTGTAIIMHIGTMIARTGG